jgi:adenine-specific DNA-methyltransferase
VPKKSKPPKTVETLTHDDKRRNIPTAEYQSVMRDEDKRPIQVAYERRNQDLDPQLVWRGKDMTDYSDLVVNAPPLYIQEKIHPKVLIDDLKQQTEAQTKQDSDWQPDLFADFNGVSDAGAGAETEFYQHDANWTNRMILGDSLQVMASLAEREGLRGKVQCIYFDPPYGIKFNSNFQWSTTSRDVKDGKIDHITREPEQVKAFRDTWRDGIHSYLTYLRDRLTVARDLLTESGSIFVQIGDENVHRVRALMDEVFEVDNYIGEVAFIKTSGLSSKFLANRYDYLLWYGRSREAVKFRQPYRLKSREDGTASTYSWLRNEAGDYRGMTREEKISGIYPKNYFVYKPDNITSQGNPIVDFEFQKRIYSIPSKTTIHGLGKLAKADRIHKAKNSIQYVRRLNDFPVMEVSELWSDTGTGNFTDDKLYVVQTGTKTIQRCLLMTSDPGDLVIDPTCGSGTTAYVAEQWGRRWITIDTSRVALALARSRLMGAKYPYYLLSDSKSGKAKEAEMSRVEPIEGSTYKDVRQGFVYERVPHITMGTIANNAEIDVIYDQFQEKLEPLRQGLNNALDTTWEDWEIPREAAEDWSAEAQRLHADWWKLRISRQQEIDASIAAKADFEYLYDKPYVDNTKVRVAGPFTVESISPHRMMAVGADDELIDPLDSVRAAGAPAGQQADFVSVILENLRTAGVQQAHKEDKITFSSLSPWPGDFVCAEGRYREGKGQEGEGQEGEGAEKRAAVFIGPEFGTVSRPDLVAAAREAADAGFDVLIACAFNFDAHASEFAKLGRVPVLKARMNADLHMADDLKNTGKGNLFVIFGEPDVEISTLEDGQLQVQLHGVDVFDPRTGEVRSDTAEGIACWFIDTDYNEESFFVRHAYFLGANDPYKSLKTTLKAEINEEAWESLHSDISRPFNTPASRRIAVKVINHLGDEVMKVFRV